MAEDHHKALDVFTTEAQSTKDTLCLEGQNCRRHTTMADNLQSKNVEPCPPSPAFSGPFSQLRADFRPLAAQGNLPMKSPLPGAVQAS
jgi:hypothetical protein